MSILTNQSSVQNQQQPDFNLNDIQNLLLIVDLATQRGAFRANELSHIGFVFDKAAKFLQAISPPPELANETAAPSLNTKINREELQRQEPATYADLFEHNGYGVLDSEIAGNTVIDIGANVGLFSLLAVERGAARIIALEAQPVIYNLSLLNNIKNYAQIEALNLAAYSKDDEILRIANHHLGSKLNDNDGEEVKTISLESLLSRYNVEGNNLVLKMDCEGSEFDILLGSKKEVIRRFAVIYIEIHGKSNKNPEYHDTKLLKQFILDQGYQCTRSIPMIGYTANAIPYEQDIYVEKYVRI